MGKLKSLALDGISLVGRLGDEEFNAKWHLEHVCPYCPEERKRARYVDGVDDCWWHYNWARGNYEIPRDFGFWNYVRYYLGLKPELDDFSEHDKAA